MFNPLKIFIVLLIIIGVSDDVLARNDSTKIVIKSPLAIGLTAEQKDGRKTIYGPNKLSSFGICSFFKNTMFHLELNIVNKASFERNNYYLGDRDKRKVPVSGFNLGILNTLNLYNNHSIHYIFGINYSQTKIYSGWQRDVSTTNSVIKTTRTVNFKDIFYTLN